MGRSNRRILHQFGPTAAARGVAFTRGTKLLAHPSYRAALVGVRRGGGALHPKMDAELAEPVAGAVASGTGPMNGNSVGLNAHAVAAASSAAGAGAAAVAPAADKGGGDIDLLNIDGAASNPPCNSVT